jgi:hypothetical protein
VFHVEHFSILSADDRAPFAQRSHLRGTHEGRRFHGGTSLPRTALKTISPNVLNVPCGTHRHFLFECAAMFHVAAAPGAHGFPDRAGGFAQLLCTADRATTGILLSRRACFAWNARQSNSGASEAEPLSRPGKCSSETSEGFKWLTWVGWPLSAPSV